MTNKKAGERKRTVTITLGPKTEGMLEAYRISLMDGAAGMSWTLTDVVSVLLRTGILHNSWLQTQSDGFPWCSEKL
jgi:hypothetical protein